MSAPLHIGPVTTLYIDMDSSDSVSNILTIKLNGTTTMILKQNGDINMLGGMVFSTVDGMQE